MSVAADEASTAPTVASRVAAIIGGRLLADQLNTLNRSEVPPSRR